MERPLPRLGKHGGGPHPPPAGELEIDPANPRYIKVVWGLGYKMEKV